MKASSGFVQLTFKNRRLVLSPSIVAALSLEPETEFYVTEVTPDDPPAGDPSPQDPDLSALEPDLTLVASALPNTAWGRLLRGSFSLPFGPGGFQRLIDEMEALRLYPRTFSVEEATPRRHVDGPIPTVLMTFEIPAPGAGMEGPDFADLYECLRQAAKARADDPRAVRLLSSALSRCDGQGGDSRVALVNQRNEPGQGDTGVTNWISSMRVLNSLPNKSDKVQHMSLTSDEHGLSLALERWRGKIWPFSREMPEEDSSAEEKPVFCLATAEEDEQTLHVHFFRLEKGTRVLTEFTLLVPSGGIESAWYNWAAKEIADCDGSILFARTSARIERRWVRVHVAVVFPDGTRCEDALRRLQARRLPREYGEVAVPGSAFTDDLYPRLTAWEVHRGDWLPNRKEVIASCIADRDKVNSVCATEPQEFSTLTNVRIFGRRCAYQARGDNPFVFTRPYGEDHDDTRARLCEQICRHILGKSPEHALIVGGHRTGKSSFMTLLERKVKQSAGGADDVVVLRLNMATTPPSLVFVSLIESLPKHRWERLIEWSTNTFNDLIKRLHATTPALVVIARLVTLCQFFAAVWYGTDIPAALGKLPAEKHVPNHIPLDDQRLREVLAGWNPNSDENKALMLRESAALLTHALADVPGGEGTRVIIVVDEFADSGFWQGKWVYPAWRSLIEGRLGGDDKAAARRNMLRWVFLSSRPLDEVADYSPLGNAVREYNLPPLSDLEAGRVLLPFYVHAAAPPVLIYDARLYLLRECAHHPYLLQVVAHHVWEAALDQPAAVVTLALVKRVIDKRVLPEIGDFFARECAHLGPDCRAALRALAAGKPGATLEPHHRKAIERAGLGGRKDVLVVPLLLTWIRSGGLAAD